MCRTLSWPKGSMGAVSLTFDDGMQSQLTVAVPLLNEYLFKGTFYLSGLEGENYRERLKQWKPIADVGHEMGNHSLSHTCSCNFSEEPRSKGLENMTINDIHNDITVADKRIKEIIPNGSRTFAYPCYQTGVGRGTNKRSYVPVVAEMFVAGRGWGEYGYANSLLTCDLAELWGWSAERMSLFEMTGLAAKAALKGKWVIFTFHGINEGHLSVSEHDLRGLLEFLSENRGKIWVAPVVEVAEYIIKERKRLGITY